MKLLIVCLFVMSATVLADFDVSRNKLHSDTFKNYEKEAYPSNVTVNVAFYYVCGSVDHDTDILSSRALERLTWVDSRLAWKPESYNGIKKQVVSKENIWTPLFKFINSFPLSENIDEVSVEVYWNGTVVWWIPVSLSSPCNHIDDDLYSCPMKFEMWSHTADEVHFALHPDGLDLDHYLKTCPYVVTSSSMRTGVSVYKCCPDAYSYFSVSLKLKSRHHADGKSDNDEKSTAGKKSRSEKFYSKKEPCFWPHC